MEGPSDFEELYRNVANSIWEDVSLERLVSNYRRCQHALARVIGWSHLGSGKHKNHITYIVQFIKTEALPFINQGTPHLITAEDWEILDIELDTDTNIDKIKHWQKKRLTSSDVLDTVLKQQSILDWLISRACCPLRYQPKKGRPTASAPWR